MTAAKIAITVAALALVAFSVSCEISLWHECRADHSWWYCMRVLNK